MANRNTPAWHCNDADPTYDYLVLPPEGKPRTHSMFPKGEVNIVAGPSGGGKSRWLLKFIEDWKLGRPLFGRLVCPKEFAFLSYDRSNNGMKRTADSMGISLNSLNYYRPSATERSGAVKVLLASLMDRPQFKDVKVWFIEALDAKVPDGKIADLKVVMDFVEGLQQFAEERGIWIIGTVGSPKQKGKDRYDSPREQLIGSTGWGRTVEDIVVVQPEAADNIDDTTRAVILLPRNAPPEKRTLRLQEDGQWAEVLPPLPVDQQIINWANTHLKPGDSFAPQVVEMALSGIPKSSITTMLTRMLGRPDHLLGKLKHGLYVWKPSTSLPPAP